MAAIFGRILSIASARCVLTRQGYCYVFLCLFCCCGTKTQSVPQSPRPRQPNVIKPREIAELSQRASRIVHEIAELRGWDPKLDITIETAGSSRMMAAIRADEESQVDAQVRQAEIEFLESLGFVPEKFNFERDVTQRFSQDLLGLYSFTWRRILLTPGRDDTKVESSLRHELVHAFQDKRYDIAARVRWRPDEGDRIAAIHSLAEGEAICVTRQLEDPRHRGCLDEDSDESKHQTAGNVLESLPAAIRYALLSPYVDGTRFVQHLLRQGGWQAVESAWQGNLRSTRELLHPGRSPSTTVLAIEGPPATASFATCHTEYLDVLGEQGLASVLFGQMDPVIAAQLAASLVSDRAGVWRCGDECAVAWRMKLARPEDATGIANVISALNLIAMGVAPRIPLCRQINDGALSLLVSGRDIAITSVHKCLGEISQETTTFCQDAETWAKRLVGPLTGAD